MDELLTTWHTANKCVFNKLDIKVSDIKPETFSLAGTEIFLPDYTVCFQSEAIEGFLYITTDEYVLVMQHLGLDPTTLFPVAKDTEEAVDAPTKSALGSLGTFLWETFIPF